MQSSRSISWLVMIDTDKGGLPVYRNGENGDEERGGEEDGEDRTKYSGGTLEVAADGFNGLSRGRNHHGTTAPRLCR